MIKSHETIDDLFCNMKRQLETIRQLFNDRQILIEKREKKSFLPMDSP